MVLNILSQLVAKKPMCTGQQAPAHLWRPGDSDTLVPRGGTTVRSLGWTHALPSRDKWVSKGRERGGLVRRHSVAAEVRERVVFGRKEQR